MNKPPFNPKWTFRSRSFKDESFIKKALRKYDSFLNRQLDRLPPALRYLRLPLKPLTIFLVVVMVAGNNVILSTCLPMQKK